MLWKSLNFTGDVSFSSAQVFVFTGTSKHTITVWPGLFFSSLSTHFNEKKWAVERRDASLCWFCRSAADDSGTLSSPDCAAVALWRWIPSRTNALWLNMAGETWTRRQTSLTFVRPWLACHSRSWTAEWKDESEGGGLMRVISARIDPSDLVLIPFPRLNLDKRPKKWIFDCRQLHQRLFLMKNKPKNPQQGLQKTSFFNFRTISWLEIRNSSGWTALEAFSFDWTPQEFYHDNRHEPIRLWA